MRTLLKILPFARLLPVALLAATLDPPMQQP